MTEPTRDLPKRDLRRHLLAARAVLPEAERARVAEQHAEAVARLAREHGAQVVAAYLSFATEPATGPLVGRLDRAGVEVLVPVVRADGDLDWSRWRPGAHLTRGAKGTPEVEDAALGVDALGRADLVVVPALAVGRDGTRLGRGGGYYDRALGRVRPGVPVLALLYEGELLDEVPAEHHDQPVDVAVLPSGPVRLPR